MFYPPHNHPQVSLSTDVPSSLRPRQNSTSSNDLLYPVTVPAVVGVVFVAVMQCVFECVEPHQTQRLDVYLHPEKMLLHVQQAW